MEIIKKCVRFVLSNILVIVVFVTVCRSFHHKSQKRSYVSNFYRQSELSMALDEFMQEKLVGMSRTFDALTERLADPDLANNRAEMLRVSRERAGMESTIEAYSAWKSLEDERLGCVEMEQESGDDQEMKEMARMVNKFVFKYF